MKQIEIELENGESVTIQVDGADDTQASLTSPTGAGVVETSGAGKASREVEKLSSAVSALPDTALTTFGSSVASFAKSVLDGMRKDMSEEEADLKVEFGAAISVKGGFSLVSVGANASVKITVSTK